MAATYHPPMPYFKNRVQRSDGLIGCQRNLKHHARGVVTQLAPGHRPRPGPGRQPGEQTRRTRERRIAPPRSQPATSPIVGELNQEDTRKAITPPGTRLRRRLSNIFQRLKTLSGLPISFPSGPGILGRHQRAICQSPRNPTCVVVRNEAMLVGREKSSKSSISLARPTRTWAPSIKSWLRINCSGSWPFNAR